jgi:hypothetical protein
MIETKVANLNAPGTPGAASYYPFGYGSIHVLGWPLFPVDKYVVQTGKYAFQFVVFSFSDPGNCDIKIATIDVGYKVSGHAGVERLITGGMVFIPVRSPV